MQFPTPPLKARVVDLLAEKNFGFVTICEDEPLADAIAQLTKNGQNKIFFHRTEAEYVKRWDLVECVIDVDYRHGEDKGLRAINVRLCEDAPAPPVSQFYGWVKTLAAKDGGGWILVDSPSLRTLAMTDTIWFSKDDVVDDRGEPCKFMAEAIGVKFKVYRDSERSTLTAYEVQTVNSRERSDAWDKMRADLASIAARSVYSETVMCRSCGMTGIASSASFCSHCGERLPK